MSDQPVEHGDIDAELGRALDADAEVTRPEMPPPPRRAISADPDAPHGRDDQGEPLAPYGKTKEGRPRIKPAGPGRPRKDDKPRVIEAPKASGPEAKADYSDELYGLGVAVWMGLSSVKGGKVPVVGVKIPDCRPAAYAWNDSLPQMVGAWNNAARANPTIRGWVGKLGGDSSWAWLVGVTVATGGFLGGCAEYYRGDNEHLRKEAIAVNDQNMREFLGAQLKAATLMNQAAAGAAGEPPAA